MTLWKTLLLAVLDPWPDTAGFGLTGAHICPQEPWAPGPAEGPAGAAGCGTPGRWVPRSGAMSRGPHGHTEPWDRRTGSPSGAQPQPLSWAGKRRGWGSSASKLACVELPSEQEIFLSFSPKWDTPWALESAFLLAVCIVGSSRGTGSLPQLGSRAFTPFHCSPVLCSSRLCLEYRAGQMCFLCSLCNPAAGRSCPLK